MKTAEKAKRLLADPRVLLSGREEKLLRNPVKGWKWAGQVDWIWRSKGKP